MAGGTDIKAGARHFTIGMRYTPQQVQFHTAEHIMSEQLLKYMQAQTMKQYLFTAIMLLFDISKRKRMVIPVF